MTSQSHHNTRSSHRKLKKIVTLFSVPRAALKKATRYNDCAVIIKLNARGRRLYLVTSLFVIHLFYANSESKSFGRHGIFKKDENKAKPQENLWFWLLSQRRLVS